MNIPEELKYTKEHEWIKVDGDTATIGITDFAQSELGDIVYVDIDPDMEEVVKGESFGTLEAVKTVSDLFSPCSGKLSEINSKLEDEPELINTDPYGEGWIIKVTMSNPDDLNDLISAEDYKAQITA